MILFPIMLIKVILNTLHIMINTSNHNFYDRYCKPFSIIIASPFIILASILVDFVTLPKIFWKNEELFELKY